MRSFGSAPPPSDAKVQAISEQPRLDILLRWEMRTLESAVRPTQRRANRKRTTETLSKEQVADTRSAICRPREPDTGDLEFPGVELISRQKANHWKYMSSDSMNWIREGRIYWPSKQSGIPRSNDIWMSKRACQSTPSGRHPAH